MKRILIKNIFNYRFHYIIISLIILIITLIYYGFYYFEIRIHSSLFNWFWGIFLFEYLHDCLGVLFYIPIAYSAFIGRRTGIFFIWLISLIIALPFLLYYARNITSIITNLSIFFFPITLIMIVIIERRWRERTKRIMLERDAERQAHASKILKAQEDERKHISYEIHDNIIQNLLGIANKAQQIVSDNGNDPKKEQIEQIRDSVLESCSDLRKVSLDLRPNTLDTLGLIPAIRTQLEKVNKDQHIETKVIVSGEIRKLSPEAESNIFRVIQEAINNSIRHAKAKEIKVFFDFIPSAIMIKIQDNGQGFPASTLLNNLDNSGKLGILSMQYRIGLLNGKFDIFSQAGKGTEVLIELKTQVVNNKV